jgi:hypothetical protein
VATSGRVEIPDASVNVAAENPSVFDALTSATVEITGSKVWIPVMMPASGP